MGDSDSSAKTDLARSAVRSERSGQPGERGICPSPAPSSPASTASSSCSAQGGMGAVFARDARRQRQARRAQVDAAGAQPRARTRASASCARRAPPRASTTRTSSTSTTSAATAARSYLVMEYLRGETLPQRLERARALRRAGRVALLMPALRGVAAAHAARRHPPRPQARQHLPVQRTRRRAARAQGARLRHLQDRRPATVLEPGAHAQRRGDGHALLHVARASARREPGRRAHRRLRARRDPVRDADAASGRSRPRPTTS